MTTFAGCGRKFDRWELRSLRRSGTGKNGNGPLASGDERSAGPSKHRVSARCFHCSYGVLVERDSAVAMDEAEAPKPQSDTTFAGLLTLVTLKLGSNPL